MNTTIRDCHVHDVDAALICQGFLTVTVTWPCWEIMYYLFFGGGQA